jgi:hypothetical protein
MEGALVQAVRNGAEDVSQQMQKFEPAGVTFLNGTPRARGFLLDGYGIFFDVEIPDMNQSVVWSLMVVQRDRVVGDALVSLQTALETMPDNASRQQAQSALQQISRSVGRPAAPRAPQTQPLPGQVTAASTPVGDPNILYSEAVKNALVDAMLALQLTLGPEEWLTVAARASESPLTGAGLSDSMTIVLRVKGSDLAAYWADPAKGAAIREKVKVDAKVF